MFKVILLTTLVVATIARPDGGYGHNSGSHEHDDSRSYEFSWDVKSSEEGLDFGHNEQKTGGKTTGFYYVLLPDTRKQKVSYYVEGDSGYVAEVSYSGETQFDSDESRDSREGGYYKAP